MDYLQIAQDVVNQAQASGAEAEAYLSLGQQTNIRVDRGEVEKLSQAGSKGLGVRVIKDGQMGYAYTSDFSPDRYFFAPLYGHTFTPFRPGSAPWQPPSSLLCSCLPPAN